ncbi:Methyltransferase type 11 [Geobacter metallireducens RCH3]|uniref:Glycosyltransferase and SAM-dependent methyltransferase, putative n=1 Tax=Geobacter metallireducens (strain ATCC 53774 / DSM 7210 / GS-15) TaxID=269799 RepID=Q39YH5_GEOMG|nr:methyltransferase domain-containing protein [Geobacter metallireducens]ABB30699.1 glycosyltransferase and SAM-dependent methyltransferase, putative [Geobacter metallireducens GS-15]EHP85505.1 Methyltransferase type 11 [Geobacter metallireducens RCH3]
MKIAIFRTSGVIAPFVIDGYITGFREAGHEVWGIDLTTEGLDFTKLRSFQPDFVLAYGYNGFCKSPNGYALRELGIPLVSLHYDCPYLARNDGLSDEINNFPEYYYEFVWDDSFLELLRNDGTENCDHILLATDPTWFHPIALDSPCIESSVCFVGGVSAHVEQNCVGIELVDKFIDEVIYSKLHNMEVPTFEICKQFFSTPEYRAVHQVYTTEPASFWQMIYYKIHGKGSTVMRKYILDSIEGVDLHIYGGGNGWDKPNAIFHEKVPYGTELSKAFQQYALNLNISSLQLEKAINNRPFDAYASKAFMLNDYRDDMIRAFPAHWEEITFRNLDEFAEKGEYFLTHAQERRELVADLYDHTLRHHTYRHRADQIVEKLAAINFLNRPQQPKTQTSRSILAIDEDNYADYCKDLNTCPVCGGTEFNLKFSFLGHEDYKSTFDQCMDCQAVFLNPCPTDEYLTKFYNEIYYSPQHRQKMGWDPNLDTPNPNSFFLHQRRMDFVEKYVPEELKFPRGKLLDIGCSTGAFLWEASLRYWDVCGIEISDKAAEVAREKYGLAVTTGTLLESSFDDETFDVVTAWDVLEHIANPAPFLTILRRILKQGGLILLNTPNINSADAAYAGEQWRHLDAPLHPVLYDFISIRILLKKYGFQCLEVSSGDEYHGQMKIAARKA